MILGAIAEAGGALVLTFWFIVWVEFDSLIFLLVLSDMVLLLLVLLFVLSVVTFDSEVDLLTLVLFVVLVEFDVLGEVNSVYSQNHLILTGLSNSNGLLLTKINSDGTILFQKSIAKGYTVNDVYSSDRYIGLAVGHDGILIYSFEGNDSIVLEGRLATNYANSIKIKDKNIYVGTEDGIEIFIID